MRRPNFLKRMLGKRRCVRFSASTIAEEVKKALNGLTSKVSFFYFFTEIRVVRNCIDSPVDSDEVQEALREAVRRWAAFNDAQKQHYRLLALRMKLVESRLKAEKHEAAVECIKMAVMKQLEAKKSKHSLKGGATLTK